MSISTFRVNPRLRDWDTLGVTPNGSAFFANEFVAGTVNLWGAAETGEQPVNISDEGQSRRLCENPALLVPVLSDGRGWIALLCGLADGGYMLKLMNPHSQQGDGAPWSQPATLVANVDIAQLLDGHHRPAPGLAKESSPPSVWKPEAMASCLAESLLPSSKGKIETQIAILWSDSAQQRRLSIVGVPMVEGRTAAGCVATQDDAVVLADIVFSVAKTPGCVNDAKTATRNQVHLTGGTTCVMTLAGQRCLALFRLSQQQPSTSEGSVTPQVSCLEFPACLEYQEGRTVITTPMKIVCDVMITKQVPAATVALSNPTPGAFRHKLQSGAAGAATTGSAFDAQLFVASARPKVIHVFDLDTLIRRLQHQPEMLLTTISDHSPSSEQAAHNKAASSFWDSLQAGALRRSSDLRVMIGGPGPCVVAANSTLKVGVTVDVESGACVQKYSMSAAARNFAKDSPWSSNQDSCIFLQRGDQEDADDQVIMHVCPANMPFRLYARLLHTVKNTTTTAAHHNSTQHPSDRTEAIAVPASILLLCFKRRIVAVSIDCGPVKEIAVWRLDRE